MIEASAEQRKHALVVAIATTAAAEAAIAAAHAAAEVVKLTGASRSYSFLSKGDRSLAAIKIQSAYRAHLVSFLLLGSSFVVLIIELSKWLQIVDLLLARYRLRLCLVKIIG